MKTKKNIMEILKHVYLLIITFIVLTPIYYLLVTTFKSGTEAAAKPMALPSSCNITVRRHLCIPGILHHISMRLKKCSIQERLEILLLLQYVRYLAL